MTFVTHLPAALTHTGETITNCSTGNCDLNLPNVAASNTQVNQLIVVGMGAVGAVAVLMFIIAALHFITAQGNPQEVAKARNTLLYTAVGLVVIATSEAIVAFVLGYL